MFSEEKYISDQSGLLDSDFEIENRIRNLLWTVSGDYSLEFKPDIALYRRSPNIAVYDGIKQGAFAKYFDREELSMYLVRKIFLQADENSLMLLTQLCVEEAIGNRIIAERPGIASMRRKCSEDILDQEYEILPAPNNYPERLRVAHLVKTIRGEAYIPDHETEKLLSLLNGAGEMRQTKELIALIDRLYNRLVDPYFEARVGDLNRVLSITLQELGQYDWKDYLGEELYEDALESYLEQMNDKLTSLEKQEVTQEMEEQRKKKAKIRILTPELLEKSHTYVELNYGKSYLPEKEEKRRNALICTGVHADCSLHFTEGILKNPVKRNYQYEYASRLQRKNVFHYHDNHRVAKRNIKNLTELLRKTLLQRTEKYWSVSDRGRIVPARIWRGQYTNDTKVFRRELRSEQSDFVVDILLDASGSQMSRQGQVALQAFIISEALSNVGIAHRVSSFCTFWDYTILHRFRDYDDGRSENQNIFNYVTSSNNRDGLAIKAIGTDLVLREEDKKIMIVLSDGRPYDVIRNRPNAKNPEPYHAETAVKDTAGEIRKLRNQGVSVLGVFAGEEKDLGVEKKIFGKDFAYIRELSNYSKIVGKYLMKQLEYGE